jgi:hypothetical protein
MRRAPAAPAAGGAETLGQRHPYAMLREAPAGLARSEEAPDAADAH